MNKYEITKRIENFAPLETQEKWDCSGWVVDVSNHDEVSKIMLCLTVTDDVIMQAKENNCDMIISHHPLFFVPFSYSPSPLREESWGEGQINIYCAHTNLDLAKGGTTDVLIENVIKAAKQLGSQAAKNSGKLKVESLSSQTPSPDGEGWDGVINNSENSQESQADNDLFAYPPIRLFTNNTFPQSFLRYVKTEISVSELVNVLKQISPNLRYINNKNIQTLHKIAFCAGSGAEFIEEAYSNGADALVTGDLKFHTALESPIVLFDIGHFESEIGVLKAFENLINNDVEVIYAQEKSPFNY